MLLSLQKAGFPLGCTWGQGGYAGSWLEREQMKLTQQWIGFCWKPRSAWGLMSLYRYSSGWLGRGWQSWAIVKSQIWTSQKQNMLHTLTCLLEISCSIEKRPREWHSRVGNTYFCPTGYRMITTFWLQVFFSFSATPAAYEVSGSGVKSKPQRQLQFNLLRHSRNSLIITINRKKCTEKKEPLVGNTTYENANSGQGR